MRHDLDSPGPSAGNGAEDSPVFLSVIPVLGTSSVFTLLTKNLQMKSITAVILLIFTVHARAEDTPPLPPAAEIAMKNYEREVAAARDRAVRQLQTILTAETQRGKLESAIAVKNAIADLSGSDGSAATSPAIPIKTGNIAIKAKEQNGAELGTVRTGTQIRLQYVEGRWAMSGGGEGDPSKYPSPDDAEIYPANRLGIYALIDGEAKLLATVPGGTKKKPFRHRFDKDYEMVMLRIQDSNAVDNSGFVVYKVDVAK